MRTELHEFRSFCHQQAFRIKATFAATLLFTAGGVQAASLNLSLNDFPDILSQFIAVSYTQSTDQLSAIGFALEINDDGVGDAEGITNGTFSLTAAIDNTGNLSGGSVEIGGTVPTLGFNSGTLLTGTLTDFGFPDAGGDPLEFLFDVSGGDVAPLYGGLPGGIILAATGFGGDFNVDFANGTGVADVAPVPIPAAIWLFGSSLVGLMAVAARRKHIVGSS